jgi:Mn-dependent DtxR family transcriptional regulator
MNKLSPRMETYLYAIYQTASKNHGIARLIQISQFLAASKSICHSACDVLKKSGLIIHERHSYIRLTESGLSYARDLSDKYSVLYNFLSSSLKISADKSRKEAELLMGYFSDDTINRISQLSKQLKRRG